jgi:hypothetical protein
MEPDPLVPTIFILPTEWSVAGGELTPTLKLKRSVITCKYGGCDRGDVCVRGEHTGPPQQAVAGPVLRSPVRRRVARFPCAHLLEQGRGKIQA